MQFLGQYLSCPRSYRIGINTGIPDSFRRTGAAISVYTELTNAHRASRQVYL